MLTVALIILQLVIFGVLIFFFRKIMNQNVVAATQHLDELRQDYERKQAEIDKQMEEARVKAQEIVTQTREEVTKQKEEIIQKAKQDQERTIQEARTQAEEIIKEAEKSRYLLLAELQKRIDKESIHRASELIAEVLPDDHHWTLGACSEGSSLKQPRGRVRKVFEIDLLGIVFDQSLFGQSTPTHVYVATTSCRKPLGCIQYRT